MVTAKIWPRPNLFEITGVRTPPKSAPDPAAAIKTPKYLAGTSRVWVIKRMSVEVESE